MPLRKIVELPNFKQDLEMFRQNYPEMDDIYEAAIEDLLDNPFDGKQSNTLSDLRSYLTHPVGDAPTFWIYYSYDLEHIYMHQIRKVDFLA